MPDPTQDWPTAWRAWLHARFGDDLSGAEMEAVVVECEAFRALWQPLVEVPAGNPGPEDPPVLDNGEVPFVHLLPPVERGPK